MSLSNPSRKPDVEAVVVMLTTAEGGRVRPPRSGYRPQHLVLPDYETTGAHEYIDVAIAEPGTPVRTRITFLSPEAHPHCLSIGQRLEIREGGRLVGHATITQILNSLLRRHFPSDMAARDPED